MSGTNKKINKLPGSITPLIADNTAIANNASSSSLGIGTMVYNTDTDQLLISIDDKKFKLSDHSHPLYSQVGHVHISGTNEPWLMTNPRLFYKEDLKNHPELVALDGSEIPLEKAQHLCKVYYGTKDLLGSDKPVRLTSSGYENDVVTLTVSNSTSNYFGGTILRGPLRPHDFMLASDQWLSTSTDIETEQYAEVSFRGKQHRIVEYGMIPAIGTSTELAKKRPTPKSWILEGCIRTNTASPVWETIHEVNDHPDDWEPFMAELFQAEAKADYDTVRLTIRKWHEGNGLNVGLKRLFIFGRENNKFALPNIPSPSPEFVYVVPYNNMNVALLHEDVGDIGTTAVAKSNLGNYRLPTDGRSIRIIDYPLLFAATGYSHDKLEKLNEVSIDQVTLPFNKEFTLSKEGIVGNVVLVFNKDITHIAGTVSIFDGSTWQELLLFSGNPESTRVVITTEDKQNLSSTKIRIAISDIDDGVSLVEAYVGTHEKDKFYIPSIPNTQPGITNYIVANNNATDVTTEIIQRLQHDVSELTKVVEQILEKPKVIKKSRKG